MVSGQKQVHGFQLEESALLVGGANGETDKRGGSGRCCHQFAADRICLVGRPQRQHIRVVVGLGVCDTVVSPSEDVGLLSVVSLWTSVQHGLKLFCQLRQRAFVVVVLLLAHNALLSHQELHHRVQIVSSQAQTVQDDRLARLYPYWSCIRVLKMMRKREVVNDEDRKKDLCTCRY